MNHGVISADIIGSTSLQLEKKYNLISEVKTLNKFLEKKYKIFARIGMGDMIEAYIPDPKLSLRIGLILKCFIKSKAASDLSLKALSNRAKYFKIHGVRLAIAIDSMELVDRKKGILEGEAIYAAGRAMTEFHTTKKQRIVIKNTLFLITKNKEWNEEFNTILELIDILISKQTARQSEIIMHRLTGKTEKEIAKQLLISQSAVNQNSTVAGWHAIEKAIQRFESVIK